MKELKSNTGIFVLFMIMIAALSRLVPHLPNFTPIAAIGLFSASYFNKKYFSFGIPLVAMLISDVFIGFHSTMVWVYGSLIVIVFAGQYLLKKVSVVNVVVSSLVSSVIFFVVTNFGVWLTADFYSKIWAGFVVCYVQAIPFFGNTLMGDLFYSSLLFGTFALAKKYAPKLVVA